MKLIVAYVQPVALKPIKEALFAKDIFRMSVMTDVLGCGQQKGYHENYRGAAKEVNLLNKLRIEIAVNDHHVQETVDAICGAARTGKIGDGKIFVLELGDCIRIRTGETGEDAIG
ncbi:MAG: transcriptional regulator [Kiritimatiellaceae bacterium]|jgi:nitrogen regulatory protein P-II 1|nr:transcriptional regulator [Kiritimatiellaceae bacterium]|tara:strand:+ start:489 stop:833 length:345 start_codon:yes stop_codon:yes gene_type:complete